PFDVTWSAINSALAHGSRGLPGGSSLAQLLNEQRRLQPELTIERILAWADAHYAAQRRWPSQTSGPVEAGARMTWGMIDNALRRGRNGLPTGTRLGRLIIKHRGADACNRAPRLTLEQVRGWVHAHHAATGKWPTDDSGPVRDAPHPETWKAIGVALA